MNHQLAHIFDRSACLTKRQSKEYISGIMTDEECYAAEVHISSCPLCSEAVDGLLMAQEESVQVLQDLNADFVKEHFHKSMPQIHLNSMTPTATELPVTGRSRPMPSWWRLMPVAIALLLAFLLIRGWMPGERQTPAGSKTNASGNQSQIAPALPQPATSLDKGATVVRRNKDIVAAGQHGATIAVTDVEEQRVMMGPETEGPYQPQLPVATGYKDTVAGPAKKNREKQLVPLPDSLNKAADLSEHAPLTSPPDSEIE